MCIRDSRILIPMINEAAFIKMEGVSDIAGIDAAMKLGANQDVYKRQSYISAQYHQRASDYRRL